MQISPRPARRSVQGGSQHRLQQGPGGGNRVDAHEQAVVLGQCFLEGFPVGEARVLPAPRVVKIILSVNRIALATPMSAAGPAMPTAISVARPATVAMNTPWTTYVVNMWRKASVITATASIATVAPMRLTSGAKGACAMTIEQASR